MRWFKQFNQSPDGLYHDDLNFQNFSTVQSIQQPKPATIASAATIAPVGFLTVVSGTVPITTITPPVTGQHMLAFRFSVAATQGPVTGTTGNLALSTTTVTTKFLLMVYDPNSAKYYPSY